MQPRSVLHAMQDYTREPGKNWLIVGKGPSSNKLPDIDLRNFQRFTLNHACNVVEPTIAHFVDVDAFEQCQERMLASRCLVCMPWYPHVKFKAKDTPVVDYPWAKYLGDRLVSYNSTTASAFAENTMLPRIRLRKFSAVAAFNIVVPYCPSQIYSIGIDGGMSYGVNFNPDTKLSNGQSSFDSQMPEIRRTINAAKIRWVKL